MKLCHDLGIGQKVAWYTGQCIREVFDGQAERFVGAVEVDEAYTGGKVKHKYEDRKLSVGRGAVGKTPVASAKDPNGGQVCAQVLSDTKRATLHGFIQHKADANANATIYIYDNKSYQGMPFDHQSVRQGVSEYVRSQVHLNGLESFWARLKTGYQGTHHLIGPKFPGRYSSEYASRQTDRPSDTIDHMVQMVQSMAGKQLWYDD